jgi:hypothetical protein
MQTKQLPTTLSRVECGVLVTHHRTAEPVFFEITTDSERYTDTAHEVLGHSKM